MSQLILMDDQYSDLRPIADLRASFSIRTGGVTTESRLSEQWGRAVSYIVGNAALAKVIAERHKKRPVNQLPETGDDFLIVNGRCSRLAEDFAIELGEAIVDHDGSLLIARLDRDGAGFLLANTSLPEHTKIITRTLSAVLRKPWEVLTCFKDNLAYDLSIASKKQGGHARATDLPAHVYQLGDESLMIGESVSFDPGVVLDLRHGPIVIRDRVQVGAHAVIEGPAWIGESCVIAPQTHLRQHNSLGPWCKVGGEIGGSILQGFSNKGHFGYLGDSYLGQWVNLGAGTTTSNLKNTYGIVQMQTSSDGKPSPTGLRFLGSIIGDHVKTAIGTRLLTGSCIETGAMIACSRFPGKLVPAFSFLTDRDADARYELERFLEVAERVMSRREVVLSDAMRALITAHYRNAQEFSAG